MNSSISHNIKHRKVAKDVFITPSLLAKSHIEMIPQKRGDLWLDPCRYSKDGSYYSQFPDEKDWCEITEKKDFLNYKGKPDIICGNPPYSMLDKWFTKSIELNPRVISYLIGIGNLTARRLEMFDKAGYGLTKIKMLKVFSWYGMSILVVWEKGKKQIIDYDRKIWRTPIAIGHPSQTSKILDAEPAP